MAAAGADEAEHELDVDNFDLKWVDDRDEVNSASSSSSAEDYDAAPEEGVTEAKTRPIEDAEKFLMPLQAFLAEIDPSGHVAACDTLLKQVRAADATVDARVRAMYELQLDDDKDELFRVISSFVPAFEQHAPNDTTRNEWQTLLTQTILKGRPGFEAALPATAKSAFQAAATPLDHWLAPLRGLESVATGSSMAATLDACFACKESKRRMRERLDDGDDDPFAAERLKLLAAMKKEGTSVDVEKPETRAQLDMILRQLAPHYQEFPTMVVALATYALQGNRAAAETVAKCDQKLQALVAPLFSGSEYEASWARDAAAAATIESTELPLDGLFDWIRQKVGQFKRYLFSKELPAVLLPFTDFGTEADARARVVKDGDALLSLLHWFPDEISKHSTSLGHTRQFSILERTTSTEYILDRIHATLTRFHPRRGGEYALRNMAGTTILEISLRGHAEHLARQKILGAPGAANRHYELILGESSEGKKVKEETLHVSLSPGSGDAGIRLWYVCRFFLATSAKDFVCPSHIPVQVSCTRYSQTNPLVVWRFGANGGSLEGIYLINLPEDIVPRDVLKAPAPAAAANPSEAIRALADWLMSACGDLQAIRPQLYALANLVHDRAEKEAYGELYQTLANVLRLEIVPLAGGPPTAKPLITTTLPAANVSAAAVDTTLAEPLARLMSNLSAQLVAGTLTQEKLKANLMTHLRGKMKKGTTATRALAAAFSLLLHASAARLSYFGYGARVVENLWVFGLNTGMPNIHEAATQFLYQ